MKGCQKHFLALPDLFSQVHVTIHEPVI
jgi:hypothetical protein